MIWKLFIGFIDHLNVIIFSIKIKAILIGLFQWKLTIAPLIKSAFEVEITFGDDCIIESVIDLHKQLKICRLIDVRNF